jgi:hypothetical protein
LPFGQAQVRVQRFRHHRRRGVRRGAEAAVADHTGRNAARQLERHVGIHERGEVVVRMHVDEARREREASGHRASCGPNAGPKCVPRPSRSPPAMRSPSTADVGRSLAQRRCRRKA